MPCPRPRMNIERRDARRHRKVICCKCRTVDYRALHAIEDLVNIHLRASTAATGT